MDEQIARIARAHLRLVLAERAAQSTREEYERLLHSAAPEFQMFFSSAHERMRQASMGLMQAEELARRALEEAEDNG